MRFILFILVVMQMQCAAAQDKLSFFDASHPYIQYTGRIDFSNPKLPRFWQPGVYIVMKFSGSDCDIMLNDEVLWGKNYNYLEVIVDGKPVRIQTKAKSNTIPVASGLKDTIHNLVVCKNTEANIGYLEFVGINCKSLIKPDEKPSRTIEYIGNSITCGASADNSGIPCHKGLWHDQHNAYMSYGPVMARALNAQYHLSSVSGIGLMHSCCNMDIVMPPVYDKVSMRDNKITWDFKKYTPAVIIIELGQNDGIQDVKTFCDNYVSFARMVRYYNPAATIICITSPMADDPLRAFLKTVLKTVTDKFNKEGDKNIFSYVFTKQYVNGCDYHPDLEQHKEIATLLSAFVKEKMNW